MPELSQGVLTVTPGQIRVSCVVQWVDTDLCKTWEIDCHTKYPEWIESWHDENKEVLLVAGERTLRPSCAVEPTVISLALDNSWVIVVDAARYSVRICAYKRTGDGRVIWSDQ